MRSIGIGSCERLGKNTLITGSNRFLVDWSTIPMNMPNEHAQGQSGDGNFFAHERQCLKNRGGVDRFVVYHSWIGVVNELKSG